MSLRKIAGCGYILSGIAVYSIGLFRLMSGNLNGSGGRKFRWLEGFFLVFGGLGPYVAGLFYFSIGAALIIFGYRYLTKKEASYDR